MKIAACQVEAVVDIQADLVGTATVEVGMEELVVGSRAGYTVVGMELVDFPAEDTEEGRSLVRQPADFTCQ